MKPRMNHRITVDLTDAADADRRRLVILTGTSTATLVRTALNIISMAIDAGGDITIAGVRVQLPFTIPTKGK